MTKVSFDRNRITQPGTVFVFKKDGIEGDLATDATFTKNTIDEGNVHSATGVITALQAKRTNHLFSPGEKAYMWRIEITGDDLFLFFTSKEVFSVNQSGGRTNQVHYKAMLDFKFPSGELPAASFADVKAKILQIVATEADFQAAPVKTISLGQTPTEVEEIVGKPEKIVNLGTKITYIYKDIKVIFQDGKVADVRTFSNRLAFYVQPGLTPNCCLASNCRQITLKSVLAAHRRTAVKIEAPSLPN